MAAAQHGVVDELDLRILGALIDHPQASIKDVALTLGVPASTCAFRLRTLRSRGVITGSRLEIDPAAVGAPVQAMIRVLLPKAETRTASSAASSPAADMAAERSARRVEIWCSSDIENSQ